MTRSWVCAALLVAAATATGAQTAPPASDSARCDSVLAAARVDSVPAAMFVAAARLDGPLDERATDRMTAAIGSSFVPPRPFRLSVFSGPARMRMLRPMGADSVSNLRAPVVIGYYRFMLTDKLVIHRLLTVRASLMPGFDSAAVTAIREAVAGREGFNGVVDEDSVQIEVRFGSDSVRGSRRIATASFPRMPVIDATPVAGNPPADFPEDERADSVMTGEVVLRFVVDRQGVPALETVQAIRATSLSFIKSALIALPKQRFTPATVHGCAVAQVVDYPFSFLLTPERASESSRVKERIRH